MAKIQYVAALSDTAPYLRVLKFIDDVGIVQSDFPFASPVNLAGFAFSPDGKSALAIHAATGTAILRLWNRPTALSDEWTEASITALPASTVGRAIEWMTDTNFIVAGDSILRSGVIDRATGAVTYTTISTSTTYAGPIQLVRMQDGETFYSVQVFGDNSSAGIRLWYNNAGVWTGVSNNYTSFPTGGVPVDENTVFWHRYHATAAALGQKLPEAKPPTPIANGFIPISAADNVASPSATSTTLRSFPAISGDKQMGLVPIFTAPWIAVRNILNYKTPAYFFDAGAGVTFPALSAAPRQMVGLDANVFLIAPDSNTITTGRVRGWKYTDPSAPLTEIDAISDLFDDWSAIIKYFAVSYMIEVGAVAGLIYNEGLSAIIGQTVNMASLKIALLTAAATFDATADTLAEALGANEATGSSWPAGGVDADTATISDPGGGEVHWLLTIPETSMIAAGTFTFQKAVIYDDAHVDKLPLVFLDFPEEYVVSAGDSVEFTSPGNRLITIGQGTLT